MTKTISVGYLRQFLRSGAYATDFGILHLTEADINHLSDPGLCYVVIEQIDSSGDFLTHWQIIGFTR